MAGTSTSARKHIRMLSNLFADGETIVMQAIEETVRAYKKKKYLRQSIKRLLDKGFLERSGNRYSPTAIGIKYFRRRIGSRPILRQKLWDGKWRLITFDVPGGYNAKRDQLRALLRESDFFPLQKSVWICPTLLSEKFWKLVIKYELEKYCKVMIVEILEGDENLREYFKLTKQ